MQIGIPIIKVGPYSKNEERQSNFKNSNAMLIKISDKSNSNKPLNKGSQSRIRIIVDRCPRNLDNLVLVAMSHKLDKIV